MSHPAPATPDRAEWFTIFHRREATRKWRQLSRKTDTGANPYFRVADGKPGWLEVVNQYLDEPAVLRVRWLPGDRRRRAVVADWYISWDPAADPPWWPTPMPLQNNKCLQERVTRLEAELRSELDAIKREQANQGAVLKLLISMVRMLEKDGSQNP